MQRIFALAALTAWCLLALPATAEQSDEAFLPFEGSKRASSFLRSDSLEMPGITACHQCEWRPKPNNMAAADQCGVGSDGGAKLAEFECGFSEDCQRVCNFVRCLTP